MKDILKKGLKIFEGKKYICRSCGHIGKAGKRARGHTLVTIFLLICFIVPGIFYSIWRLTTKEKVCTVCGNANLIPVNSPVGQKIISGDDGIEKIL